MLQLKTIQDARRTRSYASGGPPRPHHALAAGRTAPTSGSHPRSNLAGLNGSGRALTGARTSRYSTTAHWLSKPNHPTGLHCRAVAVESRSSPPKPDCEKSDSLDAQSGRTETPELHTGATATIGRVDNAAPVASQQVRPDYLIRELVPPQSTIRSSCFAICMSLTEEWGRICRDRLRRLRARSPGSRSTARLACRASKSRRLGACHLGGPLARRLDRRLHPADCVPLCTRSPLLAVLSPSPFNHTPPRSRNMLYPSPTCRRWDSTPASGHL